MKTCFILEWFGHNRTFSSTTSLLDTWTAEPPKKKKKKIYLHKWQSSHDMIVGIKAQLVQSAQTHTPLTTHDLLDIL